jgi:cobalt-zinc-cadmium efflux system outer membrane protein
MPLFTAAKQGTPAMESVPLPAPSPGQADAAPATLEELEIIALAHNPTLVQASAKLEALRGRWVQDGLYPNPRVQYKGDEMGDQGTSGFQGFSVMQEIVTAGKLGRARDVVTQQIQQADRDYAAQTLRVRTDVRLRFYDVLLAQRSIDLNQELERINSTAAEAAQGLFAANEVGRSDVLQARLELELVRLQLVKARNSYQAAWRRLAAVIGVLTLEPRPLSGELRGDTVAASWDEMWNRLANVSPEIASAQARLAAARTTVDKAYADRWPNFDFEVAYSHDNSTGFDTTGVTVNVPLPLFNRNQGAIRQAQSDVVAAEAEVGRTSLDLRDRLAATFERYANAREMVDRYEKSILGNAKESIELTSARYRAGEGNYTALLLAQRTYLQTEVSYLEALRELRASSTLMDGLLLSDSLATAPK